MAELNFDFSAFGEDDLEGSYRLAEPGRYHVLVSDVDDSFEKDENAIYVTFEILAGEPIGQAGLRHRERFAVTPKAMVRVAKFSQAVGLAAGVAGQNSVRLDLQKAVGRELWIELQARKYTDTTAKNAMHDRSRSWDSPPAPRMTNRTLVDSQTSSRKHDGGRDD